MKTLLSKLVGIYSKFNPLVYQMRYTSKTIKDKKKAIAFDNVDKTSRNKIEKQWGKLPEPEWFRFYYTVGDKTKIEKYIPDPLFYKYVDAKLNNWEVCKHIDDKGLYDLLFSDVNRPKTLARVSGGLLLDEAYNIISITELLNICSAYSQIIIKPSVGSSGGKGIVFLEKENFHTLNSVLGNMSNCVIQEVIGQHRVLSDLHPESLNTIRIMTMLDDNEVRILSSILRMGVGKSKVDNISSGGIACGIDEEGRLRDKAFNAKGICFKSHPETGDFNGVLMPGFDKCIDVCKRTAPRFSRFSRLISWDFAINENSEPVLIEANLYGGELDFHQMCNGPILGESMELFNKFIKR